MAEPGDMEATGSSTGDLFKSRSAAELAKLPRLSEEDVKKALEKGREDRAKAESSVQPGNVGSSRVFYK